jgi:hypothetical protein
MTVLTFIAEAAEQVWGDPATGPRGTGGLAGSIAGGSGTVGVVFPFQHVVDHYIFDAQIHFLWYTLSNQSRQTLSL